MKHVIANRKVEFALSQVFGIPSLKKTCCAVKAGSLPFQSCFPAGQNPKKQTEAQQLSPSVIRTHLLFMLASPLC